MLLSVLLDLLASSTASVLPISHPMLGAVLVALLAIIVWRHGTALAWPKAPPSPFRLPLLGNLLQFTAQPQNSLPSLVSRHGSIFTIFAGQDNPMVLVNSPNIVPQVFRGARGADRPPKGNSIYFDIITRGGKDIAWENFGPRVAAARKLISSSIVSQHGFQRWDVDGRIGSSFDQLTGAWTDAIKQQTKDDPSRSNSPHAIIIPEAYFKCFSMTVIASIVFGKTFAYTDNEFQVLNTRIQYLMKVLGAGNPRDAMHWLRWFPSSEQQRVQSENDQLQAFIRSEIARHVQRRQQMKSEGKEANHRLEAHDFVDEVLIAKESPEFEQKSDWFDGDKFSCMLQDLLVAGTDTTAVTLSWATLWAANYPEKQAKVREEIDRVLGDRQARVEDLSDLPYTQAYLKETMRVWPVGPLAIPHAAKEDIPIQDNGKEYNLPKGTIMCLNTLCLHRNPDTWGPDAHVFRPERFLDSSLTPEFLENNFVPFGYGLRKCPGAALAEREMSLAWIGLMQRFYIFRPSEALIPETSEWGLALAPKPFEIKIVERKRE